PYLLQHKSALGIGGVAIVCGDLLLLYSPLLLRRSIDALEGGDLGTARSAAIAMLGVIAVGGCFKFIMRRWMIGASRHIEFELRQDFTAQCFRLSPSFFDRNKVGELMALATNDLNAIRMLLGPGIMYLLNTTVTLITAVALMLSMSPKLTLITFIPLPLLALAVQQGSRLTYKRFAVVQEKFGNLTALAQEALTGIRSVRSYAREDQIGRRFEESSQEYVDLSVAYFRVHAGMHPVMGMLAGIAAAVTLFFGGRMVIEGRLSIGSLTAFLAYVSQLTWPVIALGWTINLWQRGLASLDRVGRVLDALPEIVEAEHPAPWIERVGRLEFEGVGFAYPGARTASLRNIDLCVEAGELTAIVGSTGSGKTTLLRLLARQYDGYEGSIQIDGLDLRQISLASLREGIGYAPQDGYLFSDTIRENIGFGKTSLADGELERLAEFSRLSKDRDRFPDGWETVVGERGVTLSGGQRQRVGVARALAHRPRILLLDDVFSSVDTETEAELLSQLREAWSGRTVLLVTHRLLAVQEADQILVLDEGELVERGRHQELMDRDGIYATLFRRQLAEAELDALGEAS
ncbi:MAG TPA: ABC transporter ATP-binding protein, partial [Candidatus Krumholzibacteria bacterium]